MNAVLGVLCLGVVWVAALLVAGAALQDLRDLLAVRARLRPLGSGELGVGLFACEIVEGSGPDGALATHEIAQVGRALDADPPAIAFRDSGYSSRVHGGTVRVAGVTVAIPAEATRASVWTSRRAQDGDVRAFEEAYTAACTASGHTRTVATSVRAGDRVFVAGEITRRGDGLELRAPSGAELIVAVEDPRTITLRQGAGALLFVAAEILACVACTTLATWPPVFGRVSTLGGALCLAFFLGVTPLGVWLRDRCLPPSRAPLHGTWTRG